MQTIEAVYQSTVYHNESNHFSICVFRLHEVVERKITVKGYLPKLEKDTLYTLEGEYEEHPRFGLQFNVQRFRKMLPSDEQTIIRFLCSPLFPGIGVKLATALVEKYGNDFLNMVKQDPLFDFNVHQLSPKKKEIIRQGLQQERDIDQSIAFFTLHGLSIRQVMKLDRIYGSKAMELIRENPYRMVDEVDGIGFKTSDKLALSLGFAMDHPLRVQSAIVSLCLNICVSSGDSYTTESTLEDSFTYQFALDHDVFSLALAQILRDGRLVLDDDRLYHHSQYTAETFIPHYFETFYHRQLKTDHTLVDQHLRIVQEDLSITYDETQIHAIHCFFEDDLSIITGGPGTGKTTIVMGIIELIKQLHPNVTITLCAPTGRAAKRLKELTNVDAQTIHSVLKWDLETNTFGMNIDNPLTADILIIDEFSMVDTWLMSCLLKASKQMKKILFIGDKDQLPSVGPGFVIRDFIQSKLFTLTELEHIYRQTEGSGVIACGQMINHGDFDADALARDVKYFECRPSEVNSIVTQVVANALQKEYSVDDVQVLVPLYDGQAGIDQLNRVLQSQFNPKDKLKHEITHGMHVYREGDKILQLKNQPDDYVFNGDIGRIVEIIYAKDDEQKQNRIIADFEGQIVEYTSETFINISLAYCMSVHKAQGSEYPIVIMIALDRYRHMLQRRLYYTGVTRASKALILVGEQSAFKKAAEDHQLKERQTYLRQRLDLIKKQ